MNRKKSPAPPVGAQTIEQPVASEWAAVAGVTVPVTVAIPCDLVDPNPHQPRQDFDPAKLEELASSIKEHGLIQPIVVEPNGERFTLHAGERRLRAHKLAGLAEIAAYIVPPGSSPQKLLVRAVVENVQRADMNPLELAKAFQEMAEMGLGDSDIAKQVNKSRSVVANTRRLLNLPDDRQQQVAAGDLNERQALALLTFYQLPQPVQEKISASWHFRDVSAKPEKFNSDQIRDSLKDGLNQVTAEIKLFTADEELGGPGVRHSKCTDCPFYLKVFSQEPRCTDGDCNEAKRQAWQRRELEQAKAQTGYNFVDPARSLSYHQYTEFYSYNKPILEHALANQCPNLVLRCNRYTTSSGARPQGTSEYIDLICLHPAKGGCLCEKALKADKTAAEKLAKAENAQLKDQVVEALTTAVQEGHQGVLWAIYSRFDYSDARKLKQSKKPLDAAALAQKIAKALVDNNAYVNNYDTAEAYRKRVDAWLTEIGLNLGDRSGAQVADLDRRLSRIEAWIAELPNPAQPEHLEAIRGNLTNLAKLAEEIVTLERSAELLTRYDAAKSKLLARREEAERLDLTTGIATVRSKLADAAAFLAKTEEHTNQKLLNRGQAAADLVYDINELIRTWSGIAPYQPGSAEELSNLKADAEDLERRCQMRRRELSEGAVALQPQEVAA